MPTLFDLDDLPLTAATIEDGSVTATNAAFQKAFPKAVMAGPLNTCFSLAEDNTARERWDYAHWHTVDGSEPYPVLLRQTDHLILVLCLNILEPCVPHPAIEEISQKHRDFVSVVSHEFRTPLTSIKGFADTLLRYGGNLNDDQRTKFITTIKDQADRLTRMVENLLTVSKLGEGTIQVDCRTVPLEPMLARVVGNIEAKASQDPLYANRSVELQLPDGLPALWADPDKLEQVLTNLVDNAVKYAYANSVVTISATETTDDHLAIAIINQGDGIEADQLPKIFKRFSRADNPLTRNVEGTGLGLYITRNLVSAMAGEITVASQPGQTTTFTVTLPTATDERQAAWHAQREGGMPGEMVE